MDQESNARRVIRLIGGRQATIDLTGWPKGRIDGFIKTGNIHPKYRKELLGLALGAGKPLQPIDFVWDLVAVQPISAPVATLQPAF